MLLLPNEVDMDLCTRRKPEKVRVWCAAQAVERGVSNPMLHLHEMRSLFFAR